MKSYLLRLCAVGILAGGFCAGANAQGQAAAQNPPQTQQAPASASAALQLVPQVREVKQNAGEAFRVTRHTKIVVEKSFGRDFEGAQMLEEEIARWTGWKLKIEDGERMPGGSDFIYVGNVMEDARLRDALGTSGLAMQNGFDAQGYAILAERRRILVGGASEQGAFYGVQTLRQLLRPMGAVKGAESGMSDKTPPFANDAQDGAPAKAKGGVANESATGAEAAPLEGTSLRQSGVEFRFGPLRRASRNPQSGPPHSKEAGDDARLINASMHQTEVQSGKRESSKDAKESESKTAIAHVGELECPAVAIRDWPAMKWRGLSVDISRGPVPTLEFMEKQVRVLAGYKLNMYALYMEDVFTVKGNQIFAPPDALSPEEITQLVDYAKKYYVTIVPELETFGHLHNILRYDLYSDLAETPHGAVLTPTQPGTYDLLGKLIAQMVPLFPGPFFHIGADETFELGQGQTKKLIAQEGLGPVYLAHIAKLDGMMKPYHKTTMFWADIAEKFPQLLPTLPKDLIPVIWTYGVQPSYDADLEPFKNAGLQIFVSPGIDNWRKVYPDFNAGFMNIRNLTRDGQKYGAIGQLNTEWKDMGEELGGMDWPGLVFGAACAWQPGESSVEQFEDSYDWAFYRNTDQTFEDILNKLAATNTLMGGVKMDATHVSYFWASPFSKLGAQDAEKAAPVVHELRIDAEQAWESLLENRAKARMNADTLDDLVFAAQRLDTLGMKLEYTQEMSELYWNAYMDMANGRQVDNDLLGISSVNGRLQDLREKLTQLRAMYAERWRAENRETWLSNVLVRYDTLAEEVQSKINQVEALRDDFWQVRELPPPENMGFYMRPPRPGPQP
ncbi:MAG TPA: family 20 glycosylhydrolase [Candidatus Acidoferrales bacterium]|nr:family 20 glycosylhydrolase [Candidatus Acidoferrales bacterium]